MSQLPALHTLKFFQAGPSPTVRNQLDKLQGSHVALAELRDLTVGGGFDPFHGRLDPSKLPMLQTIYAASLEPLPRWVENLSISHLHLLSSRQLVGVDLSKLQCRSLSIIHVACASFSPAWQLADLLKLPMLRSLIVKPVMLEVMLEVNAEPSPTFFFAGSQAEYLAFMRVTVELMNPAKLRLQGSGDEAADIELNSCGHACICMCAKCRSHDEELAGLN